jgi:hypothetical protein
LFTKLNDYRHALLYAAMLFIPATLLALFLPEKEAVDQSVSAPE